MPSVNKRDAGEQARCIGSNVGRGLAVFTLRAGKVGEAGKVRLD